MKREAVLSEPALEAWGRAVGKAARTGGSLPLVLALRGPLGVGKSVLARAVARGAGVSGPMPSPTYNLVYTYAGGVEAGGVEAGGVEAGRVEVAHVDLYRLEDPDDVWELGWEDLGEGEQVVLIEWPERVEALLPRERWDVALEFATGGDPATDPLRRVRLTRRGEAPELPPLPADSTPEVGP